MTLTAAKPGGWNTEDALTSDEMNALQQELLKAIDGEGGGSYTLTAPLSIDGDDVTFGGDVGFEGAVMLASGASLALAVGAAATFAGGITIEGTCDVALESGSNMFFESGSELLLHPGAELDVNCDSDFDAGTTLAMNGIIEVAATGEIALLDGAHLDVADAATFDMDGQMVVGATGDVLFENGSTLTIDGGASLLAEGHIFMQSGATLFALSGASVSIAAANDLVIGGSSETFRVNLTPVYIENVAGVPSWDRDPANPGGALLQTDVGAGRIVFFPLLLAPGDDIVSLTMRLEGGIGVGHSGPVGNLPQLRLVSVDLLGAMTTIGTVTDSSPDETAYDALHTVVLPLGAPHTIADATAYYIAVVGEHGSNAEANTTGIRSIIGNSVVRSYRGTGAAALFA